MTDRPMITRGGVALAAASGLATAALSAQEHPRLLRGITLVVAAGAGVAVATGAAAGWREGSPEPADGPRPRMPLPVSLGLGTLAAVTFAAGGELGLRGQAAVERWAQRTTRHPRLVLGLGGAAISLLATALDPTPQDEGEDPR